MRLNVLAGIDRLQDIVIYNAAGNIIVHKFVFCATDTVSFGDDKSGNLFIRRCRICVASDEKSGVSDLRTGFPFDQNGVFLGCRGETHQVNGGLDTLVNQNYEKRKSQGETENSFQRHRIWAES